jgi:predicted N-formylglutamate amidohydrolase
MAGPPFFAVAAATSTGLLFLCDHAGREVPSGYGDLGLPAAAFERHIAYDIGAAELTRALARDFGAGALLGRYSRLYIDLNRGSDDPTLVMKLSDGQIVPGNARADGPEVERRRAFAHAPYHAAVSAAIDALLARDLHPILVSLHSFTPAWRGVLRPWEISILSAPADRRLADLMLASLRARPGLTIGDNEPYSGALKNDTLDTHGLQRGLPHVLIEVRQDLIGDPAGVTRIAQLLTACLSEAISSMHQTGGTGMDDATRTKAEAAAFRRLTEHLRQRTDVQNIELMTLAGFCRNCLGDWYAEAATAEGHAMDKAQGREAVYGMPYAHWKAQHQKEATAEQIAAFERSQKTHGG